LFAEVSERCVRRGSHTAVCELEKATLDYLDQRNKTPKPLLWTTDADLILGKVRRLSKCISDSGPLERPNILPDPGLAAALPHGLILEFRT